MVDIKIEVPVLKSVGELTEKLLGPSAEVIGDSIADYARAWRYRNLASINRKLRAIEQAKGPITGTRIEPRVGVRILAHAADEDEDEIQTLWANLIYSTISDQHPSKAIAFSSVLHQLSPFDALILSKIYSAGGEVLTREVFTGDLPDRVNLKKAESGPSKGEDFDTEKIPTEEVRFALANLVRLGLVSFPTVWDGGELSSSVYPTTFGNEFVRVCEGRKQ